MATVGAAIHNTAKPNAAPPFPLYYWHLPNADLNGPGPLPPDATKSKSDSDSNSDTIICSRVLKRARKDSIEEDGVTSRTGCAGSDIKEELCPGDDAEGRSAAISAADAGVSVVYMDASGTQRHYIAHEGGLLPTEGPIGATNAAQHRTVHSIQSNGWNLLVVVNEINSCHN